MPISTHENDEKNTLSEHSKKAETGYGYSDVKTAIADKIHKIAGSLGETSAQSDPQSERNQHLKQASQWLDQSAAYVREFDAGQADVRIRNYVREHSKPSLLIAGAMGLVIGAVFWRFR
jgi:ElaB/YqjD/DUF883 family membrane-anchored ribosome-binding protein